jgi:hypothetical protein
LAELVHLVLLAAAAPDGLSVSWEGIIGICALGTAVGGMFLVVFKFGQLSTQLDAAREQLSILSLARTADNAELTRKLDGLTRMVFEMRGARKRISQDDD